jgi:glycine/D-amino acid oxidase-like deaminating enzyme
MLDFLIVGQGIAGSMLSWFLLQSGASVKVVDAYNPSSASNVASGITNPVTGRRYVKTWLADEIIPFAANTYRGFETIWQSNFYYPTPIIRLFDSVKAQNDWSTRCATPHYAQYLLNDKIIYLDNTMVKNDFGGFEITGGSILNIKAFLAAYRNYLKQHDMLVEEDLAHNRLQFTGNTVTYKNLQARKIIFCEGATATNNPWFKMLPFVPAKGECLVVQLPGFYTGKIISQEALVMPIPWQPGHYYIGATHDWSYSNNQPSTQGRNELTGNLTAIIKTPVTVIEHWAAIRPTVRDRRPFIGLHPHQKNLGIFNGMGTKGISLAPYFAQQFAAHLVHHKPLMPEVNIARFA